MITCDQCEFLSINGVGCHETGCPNSKKKWADGEWVKIHYCTCCGEETEGSEDCCSDDFPEPGELREWA